MGLFSHDYHFSQSLSSVLQWLGLLNCCYYVAFICCLMCHVFPISQLPTRGPGLLQCAAMFCNVMQYVAVWCSMLQCSAVWLPGSCVSVRVFAYVCGREWHVFFCVCVHARICRAFLLTSSFGLLFSLPPLHWAGDGKTTYMGYHLGQMARFLVPFFLKKKEDVLEPICHFRYNVRLKLWNSFELHMSTHIAD